MSEERGKERNEAWKNDAWSLWYKKCSLKMVESLNEEYKDFLCETVNGFSFELINNLFHEKDSLSLNLLESFRPQSYGKDQLFLSLEEYLDEKDYDAVFEERIKKRRPHKRYYLIEALKISSDVSKHYPYIMMGKLIKEFLYEKCLYIEIVKKKGKYIIKHRKIDENGNYIKKDGSYKHEIMRSFPADELPDETVDRSFSSPDDILNKIAVEEYAEKYARKYWESISSEEDEIKRAAIFIKCRCIVIHENEALFSEQDAPLFGKNETTFSHIAKKAVGKDIIAFLKKDSCIQTEKKAKEIWEQIQGNFMIWMFLYAHNWLNSSKLGKKIRANLHKMKTDSKESRSLLSDVIEYLEEHQDVYNNFSSVIDFDNIIPPPQNGKD